MSVIFGIKESREIIIAGDKRATSVNDKAQSDDMNKLTVVNECLSTSFALQTAIRHHYYTLTCETAELKAKDEYKKFKALHLEDVSNAEKNHIKALEDMEMKLLGEGKE